MSNEVDVELNPDAMSLRAAAAYLGISSERMRTLLREGKIPGAHKAQASGDSTRETWSVPQDGLDEFSAKKGERTHTGGTGKPGSQVRVIGLTEETRAKLEVFVKTLPGAEVTKAHYAESAESRKRRAEKQKAEREQLRAAMEAQGIKPK